MTCLRRTDSGDVRESRGGRRHRARRRLGGRFGRIDAVFLAAGLLTILGGVYAIGLRSAVPTTALAVPPEPATEPA